MENYLLPVEIDFYVHADWYIPAGFFILSMQSKCNALFFSWVHGHFSSVE